MERIIGNNTVLQELWSRALVAINVMKYTAPFGTSIAGVMAIVGNIFCIIGFLRHRNKWAKHHVYMFVMCILDVVTVLGLVCFESFYIGLLVLTNGKYHLKLLETSDMFCKIVMIFICFGNSCSSTLPLCLAFDRLHAFYFPFTYRARGTSYAMKVALILILCNMALSMPIIIYTKPYDTFLFGQYFKMCWVNARVVPKFIGVYSPVLFATYIRGALPLCLLLLANTFVIYKTVTILHRSNKLASQGLSEENSKMRKAAKSGVSLIALSVLYMCFAFPYAILMFMAQFRAVIPKYKDFYMHFIDITSLAAYGFATTAWVRCTRFR